LRFLKLLFKLSLFLFLALITILIGLYSHAYLEGPINLNTVKTYSIYDDQNNVIFEGNSSKSWKDLKNISTHLINATISVEDKNFYKHSGFDYLRIIKAMINNIKHKNIVEGASTISQQYIKNTYLDFEQTWSRKINEAMLTLNLEVHYSKEEILEGYLNTINYGQGNYGISNAAKYYFNKEAKDLSLEEAIILAGIPKNPSNYNPVSNYDNAIKRAKIVALTMYNNNYITQNEYNNLFKDKPQIYAQKDTEKLNMLKYYEQAVIKEIYEVTNLSEEEIENGNLKIYTTLNYETQKKMEQEILNTIDSDLQVASVIINPQNGAVLALTGGMNYQESEYNRALYSKRQVGSTMKPFLYYAALENGMTSSSTFTSQQTTFTLDGGKTYSPKNYANIYGNKDITMAAAIAYSDNIYAVKTNLFLGVHELIKTAQKCGIESKLNEVASLALGTSEINLLDFAKGYTTFASGGYNKNVHFIDYITDENDNIIYEYKPVNNLVLNPNYVYILNEIMTSTTNAAFIDYNNPTALGIASKLSGTYALKTGTTDTDYWTVGYNKDVLMVMWTGYDDNKTIEISLGSKAKNVWANVIEFVDINNNTWYEMPKNVVGIPLSAVDGSPTNNPQTSNVFYYLKGSEPIYNNSDYN